MDFYLVIIMHANIYICALAFIFYIETYPLPVAKIPLLTQNTNPFWRLRSEIFSFLQDIFNSEWILLLLLETSFGGICTAVIFHVFFYKKKLNSYHVLFHSQTNYVNFSIKFHLKTIFVDYGTPGN